MSTKTQHTPGPWKIEGGDTIVGGRYIAQLSDWAITGAGGQYDEVNRALKAEREANARLIASAPELLGALREIERLDSYRAPLSPDATPEQIDKYTARGKFADIARAAIAKATGQD